MTGGLSPAPRWAWIVMVLGVVAIVVLSYLTLHRPPPPRFTAPPSADVTETTRPGATPTSAAPTPTSAAPTTPPREPARVLVVGDGLSSPLAAGGGWPELMRTDLASAGRPVEMSVTAADRAGYAEPDAAGTTLLRLAQDAGSGFDLVVFFGSRYDLAAAADVRAAATAAFAAVRTASPEVSLVVIGPAWPDANVPGYIVTNRDAVAAAAGPFGALFVDPLAQGWFAGTAAELIDPDGVRATAEGHRYLANLIGPVVARALEGRG